MFWPTWLIDLTASARGHARCTYSQVQQLLQLAAVEAVAVLLRVKVSHVEIWDVLCVDAVVVALAGVRLDLL